MWKDSETEIDYLDFSYIVEIMKDTINDEKLLPSCIGLYGDWGSGKSSLMHMCKKQLEEQKDGTVCLLFNGWLYESYDDAKTAILASILDGIKEGRELSGAAKITLKALYDSIDKFKVIKGGIKFGIDMAVTGGFGASANSRGSAVFCTNLHTGKNTRFERMDVMGEVKPECMPDWAKEKIAAMSRSHKEKDKER